MAYEVARFRPRRRRTLRRVLLVAGLPLLVCCVGAAGLGAWNYQVVRGAAGPAQRAADEFLRAVVAGDVTGAYDRLCPATRQRWSATRFAARVTQPPLAGYTIDGVRVSSRDRQRRATVAVRLTRAGGQPQGHDLPLVKDGPGWRVCGDPF